MERPPPATDGVRRYRSKPASAAENMEAQNPSPKQAAPASLAPGAPATGLQEAQERAHRFAAELNKNGFSFQHRILRLAQDLFESSGKRWWFVASEFPVNVRGRPTHIDLLLAEGRENGRIFLVGECKRVNPAMSSWCFAKAPYVRRNREGEQLFLERVRIDCRTGVSAVGVFADYASKYYYHIGLPVREKHNQGDVGGGSDRDAIQKAVDQACLGVNGLIEHWGVSVTLRPDGDSSTAYLVPVVFTTAKLYVSDIDISKAGLETGEVDPGMVQLEERPWIFFQAHVSPGLRHSYSVQKAPNTSRDDEFLKPLLEQDASARTHLALESILDREFVRTVAIVNAAGAADFLKAVSFRETRFMRIDAIPW